MQFDNIANKGTWCVSSAELDHGVGMIIDDSVRYIVGNSHIDQYLLAIEGGTASYHHCSRILRILQSHHVV